MPLCKKDKKLPRTSNSGVTFLETLVYVTILAMVLLLVSSFIYYFVKSNNQTKGDRELLQSAQGAQDQMTYQISGATGIYTPTTNANQLSLETLRYVPTGESTTYIDFFLCGTRICLKKESQNPIYLTSDTVNVTGLTFTQISTNGSISVRINVVINYKSPMSGLSQSVNLTSTASLRSY
jgi:type II secretory pathway pseudopilin PulG